MQHKHHGDTSHSYKTAGQFRCVCECVCVYTSRDPVKRQNEEECAEPAPSLLSPNNMDIVVVITDTMITNTLRWEGSFVW